MNPYQQGQPGAPPHPSYPQNPYAPYLHNIGYSGAPQSFGMPMPYGGLQQPTPYPQPYTQQHQYQQSQPGYPQGQAGYLQRPGGFPQGQPGYPQAQAQSAYPQAQGQGGYPQAQSGYPQAQTQGGYPTQNQSYPNDSAPIQSQHHSQQFSSPQQSFYGQSAQAAQPMKKPKPTVVPIEPFNPRADAEVLRKAMKGFGTDEKTIIQLLTKRSNQQRLKIAFEFKTLYGKDLCDDLKSECTGKFEDIIMALMTPLPQLYAQEMHDALSGVGTDEDTLVEVLCTMSNQEIMIIQDAYSAMYRRSLTQELSSDTSGSFKRLLVALSCANRVESFDVDPNLAKVDAQNLLRAGELRLGTDESVFNAVLCQRSFPQLALTFHEYEVVTGHPFEKAIKNEFSGDIKDGLLAIVRCVQDKSVFFAERLHASMAGMGTTDRQLIRIMVTRSEVDLGDIKEAFEAKYGKSLQSWIEGDTSGHYKKCLLALIHCY